MTSVLVARIETAFAGEGDGRASAGPNAIVRSHDKTQTPDDRDVAIPIATAEDSFRRYVGLSRARVVDRRAGERDFATHSAWLDELATALPPSAVETFTRYAHEAPTPEDPTPVHVLLDVDPTEFAQPTEAGEVPLDLQETAYAVHNGELQIVAGDRTFAARLRWDGLRQRYELHAPDLMVEAYQERAGDRRELTAAINRDQALRVVPVGRGAVYSHGRFYRPIVPIRRRGGFRLLDVLAPLDELDRVTSEKGDRIVDGDWRPTAFSH
jgi:hypothetical protein